MTKSFQGKNQNPAVQQLDGSVFNAYCLCAFSKWKPEGVFLARGEVEGVEGKKSFARNVLFWMNGNQPCN